MGKIFCLMGKSSSGKDTIFNELKCDEELGLKAIVPYTTRPKRNNEIDGSTYYFINKSLLNEYEEKGKIIEKRVYNTINGDWYYCTINDGNIDLEKNNYIIITTLEAYEKLQKYFGKESVIPIYVAVDDGVRLERALKREQTQEKPNYDEMCRRFLADNIDFSSEKLEKCKIQKFYNNIELQACICDIKNEILDNIKK